MKIKQLMFSLEGGEGELIETAIRAACWIRVEVLCNFRSNECEQGVVWSSIQEGE